MSVFNFVASDVAHRLASAGYAVFAMDYEGFGLSAGLHCYVPSFNRIVEDVVEFTKKLKGGSKAVVLVCYLWPSVSVTC